MATDNCTHEEDSQEDHKATFVEKGGKFPGETLTLDLMEANRYDIERNAADGIQENYREEYRSSISTSNICVLKHRTWVVNKDNKRFYPRR